MPTYFNYIQANVSINLINLLIYIDLKFLVNWLNAIRSLLYCLKKNWNGLSEILKERKLRLSKSELTDKRFYATKSLSILDGLKIRENLSWHNMCMTSQLNWTGQMLWYSKLESLLMIRYQARFICFAIFESSLNYCSLIWA